MSLPNALPKKPEFNKLPVFTEDDNDEAVAGGSLLFDGFLVILRFGRNRLCRLRFSSSARYDDVLLDIVLLRLFFSVLTLDSWVLSLSSLSSKSSIEVYIGTIRSVMNEQHEIYSTYLQFHFLSHYLL